MRNGRCIDSGARGRTEWLQGRTDLFGGHFLFKDVHQDGRNSHDAFGMIWEVGQSLLVVCDGFERQLAG